MTTSLELARAAYRQVSLYTVESAPCAVDLSDNTNLWGPPPAARRVLRDLTDSGLTRYPSAYASELKDALAAYVGVNASCIATGCGSDDILDSAIRAFAEPGARIAFCAPTFAMIPTFARLNGVEPVIVPMTRAWDIDPEGLVNSDARVIYICLPNNPTGTTASRGTIERVLAAAAGFVILDEAYAEFAGTSCLDLVAMNDRVLIVRTMSKAFGLAGLRVGYAVGAPALVAEVEKSRGPYKVSAVAERAAVASLTHDQAWVAERVEDACTSRERLAESLRALGLEPLPSKANFILVPVTDALVLAQRMRERGVDVRAFRELPLVGDALRITAGPAPMMDEALAALEDALRCV
jgi:histidinol-phosphate aminotransferase